MLGKDGLSNPPLRDIAIYRWVVDWDLPPKRGGFSRLCVLGKDGLKNPPLRDIAIYRWVVDWNLPLDGAGFRDYAW